MAYVTPLYSGTNEQIDYRLGLVQAGCVSDASFAYHTDGRERPLRWIGEGLAAFGLAEQGVVSGAELTPDQYDMARALVRGFHPGTGEQLVTGKVAVPAAAKVSTTTLVTAVQARAAQLDIAPEALFTGKKTGAAYATAAREAPRHPGRAALKVTDAERLARAAGLAPEQVWTAEVLTSAKAALYEDVPALDAQGHHQFTNDGRLKTRKVERRESVRIHAFDVGVGVKKWASTLLGLGPDNLVDRVEDIYVDAVNRSFSWLEGRTSYVRIGTEGRGQQARFAPSSGMAGWVMTHRAARPVGDAEVGDPHWHVHITVANFAQGPDGKWRGIAGGGRDLMRHTHAIDAVTHAQIRRELRLEYGVEFVRSERTGEWTLAHVPDEAIALFSKRHNQVMATLKKLGYDGNTGVSASKARWLTRHSRDGKTEMTAAADATLRELWRREAVDAGLDPDDWMPRVLAAYNAGHTRVDHDINASAAARYGVDVDGLVAALTDPEHGLTAHQRRFTHLDALVAVAEALPLGATVSEVEQLTSVVLAHPAFVALDGPQAAQAGVQLAGAQRMSSGQVFTTADVPQLEQDILDAVTARSGQNFAVVTEPIVTMAAGVAEAAQGFPLSAEQHQVLHAVVGRGRQFEFVEGPPGTGKTATMRAARLAWEAQGFVVAGAATAAVAGQNLAAESGIESRTVAQWRWRIAHRTGLDGVDVLVLDEANLTSDRDRAALYAEALRTGTKVVEVGDPKQLRGVGVGSMFGYLHATVDGPRLTENRRQLVEDERRALAAFRSGAYLEALHTWERLGGVVATETADEAIAAMVSQWMAARAGAPDPHTEARGVLMLAATNEQVARLNAAAQAVRAAEGELGEGREFRTQDGPVTFHVGDQVLIRRNDRRGDQVDGDVVLNGYRGVITGVSDQGVDVAWYPPGAALAGEPQTALCSPAYIADGGLSLGHALTGHKAEGLTISAAWDRPDGTRNQGTVLTYGPGQDNPGLYVSLSRDRGQALLFASREELETDREQVLYGVPRDQADLTERVLAALADHAADTAESANDRPVLVDLGRAPSVDELHVGASQQPVLRVDQDDTEQQVDERQRLDISPEATWSRMARWRTEQLQRDEALQATVTDAEREQWRDLVRRELHARAQHDTAALHALQVERCELADHLGPERIETLRREAEQRLAQWQADRQKAREQEQPGKNLTNEARIERLQLLEQWHARPHSTLSHTGLDQAADKTAHARDEHQAAAEQYRRELAEREPAVAAGHGPHVTALNTELAELRQAAELARQVEQIERRWNDTVRTAGMSAANAADKELAAENAPWYRPGLRDRLTKQAADLRAASENAHTAAAELARQAAELQQQLGRPGLWRQVQARADRAEAGYEQNQQRAHAADQAEVQRLRARITSRSAAAVDAGAEHDELVSEKQLRATMPTHQRTAEAGFRREWTQEQRAERAAQQAAEQQRQDRNRDLDYNPQQSMQHGIEHRGPSLGR